MSVRSTIAVAGTCVAAGFASGEAMTALSTMNVSDRNAQAQLCAEGWPDVARKNGEAAVASCVQFEDYNGNLDTAKSKQTFLDENTRTPSEITGERNFNRVVGVVGGGGAAAVILFFAGGGSEGRRRKLIAKKSASYYELA